ncbi:Uncharacterised protein [Mycobacteroides abscessus subsp. abscessus]|nr:Uncharacterised protein [Mycobacteroides abscessus subsp. abscessus]
MPAGVRTSTLVRSGTRSSDVRYVANAAPVSPKPLAARTRFKSSRKKLFKKSVPGGSSLSRTDTCLLQIRTVSVATAAIPLAPAIPWASESSTAIASPSSGGGLGSSASLARCPSNATIFLLKSRCASSKPVSQYGDDGPGWCARPNPHTADERTSEPATNRPH